MCTQMVMRVLFVAINGFQLFVLWKEGRANHLEPEARRLYCFVFNLLFPGEFLRIVRLDAFVSLSAGEMSYFTSSNASVNVEAALETRQFKVEVTALDQLRMTHPETHVKIVSIMRRAIAEKLRQTTSTMCGAAVPA